MIYILVSIIVGIVIGTTITRLYFGRKNDGELVLNNTDPDYATAGFIFNIGASEVVERNYIVIKVKTQK